MPRSILLGRPLPPPGEPLFLPEDTAAVFALAQEESDTCQSCGYPKAWCRDSKHQFAFDVVEETCWPSYRRALRAEAAEKEGAHAATRSAKQTAVRFRDGVEPSVTAGLGIDEDGDVSG